MPLMQDLRYALRVLMKKPGFTIVAVLSLALGIGANTAIFTVINAVFLHPLDIEEPSRVVELFTRDTKTVQTGNFTLTPSSLQNYEDYRDQNQVFTGLAGYFGFGLQWTRNGETQGVPAILASANYFDVLGIKASRGRLFSPDEDRQLGAGTVAVLSHSLWTREFGSDPGIVGQTHDAERHAVHRDRHHAAGIQGDVFARGSGPRMGSARHARAADDRAAPHAHRRIGASGGSTWPAG